MTPSADPNGQISAAMADVMVTAGQEARDIAAVEADLSRAAAPGTGTLHVIDMLGSALAERSQQVSALHRRLKRAEEALVQSQAAENAVRRELEALQAPDHPPTPHEVPAR